MKVVEIFRFAEFAAGRDGKKDAVRLLGVQRKAQSFE
jgi:hypothetical protein